MPTIKIDLSQTLTNEAIALALPKLGSCHYSAPCIIGACMTEDERKLLADANLDDFGIDNLCKGTRFNGDDFNVEFATGRQAVIAEKLQMAFDEGNLRNFMTEIESAKRELGLV